MTSNSQEMIHPPPCWPGDRVGVAAPASPFHPNRFKLGISELRSMGFQLAVDKRIHQRYGHLAGSDAQRIKVLHRYFADNSIRAIVCARGGFGTMRLLNQLDWNLIRRNPKPLIGFSDISALLDAICRRAGMICYHGPMITTISAVNGQTRQRFVSALSGEMLPPLPMVRC